MMTLSSPSFGHGDLIPRNHTADGLNRSPPLTWSNPPAGTRSLALLVEDPDAPDPAAPQRIFAHWLVYNLPAGSDHLMMAASREDLPPGTVVGRNDFGQIGYGGPAPPIGRHRYFFRLFALDTVLPAKAGGGALDRAGLMRAMQGHVIEEGELMGMYERERVAPQPHASL
jgi:Raf kinase inhibitor-like YbhB/YbcL family protein